MYSVFGCSGGSLVLSINTEALSSSFLSRHSYLGHLEMKIYINNTMYEEQDFTYFENEILTPLDVSPSL